MWTYKGSGSIASRSCCFIHGVRTPSPITHLIQRWMSLRAGLDDTVQARYISAPTEVRTSVLQTLLTGMPPNVMWWRMFECWIAWRCWDKPGNTGLESVGSQIQKNFGSLLSCGKCVVDRYLNVCTLNHIQLLEGVGWTERFVCV